MTTIIGVRFRTAGKAYYFDPLDYEVKMGDHVIVETARGIEYGYVACGRTEVSDDKVVAPLRPVLRVATEEDDLQAARLREKEKEAMAVCAEKVAKHKLEIMDLVH